MGTPFVSHSHELNAHQVHRMDNQSDLWGDMKDIFGLKLKENMFTATRIRPIEGPVAKNHVGDLLQTVRHHQLVAKSDFWAAATLTPTLTCVRLMHNISQTQMSVVRSQQTAANVLVMMSGECKATPRDSTSNSFQLASAKTNLNSPR